MERNSHSTGINRRNFLAVAGSLLLPPTLYAKSSLRVSERSPRLFIVEMNADKITHRQCSVEGCDRKHRARGFCRMHWRRYRKTGDPGPATKIRSENAGKKCQVDTCIRNSKYRGFCGAHYQRFMKYGDANVVKNLRGIPSEERLRIMHRVNSETGCWEWCGYRNFNGYGEITIPEFPKQSILVHRLAAHYWLGMDLDSPLFILHSCDNPPCINPQHLRCGTAGDNARDCVSRGRSRSGENHPQAKLTEEEVRIIRALKRKGTMTNADIARKFGICKQMVGHISRRDAWKNI